MGEYKEALSKPGQAYFGKVPADRIDEMAKIWGEGSPNLTKLLKYCMENNIFTSASCKGHEDNPTHRFSYISFRDMPKEYYSFLTDYISKNSRISDLYDITLTRLEPDANPLLTVYCHNFEMRS